jgi:enamine deaminase RidA (YjgF/YER057c/UK114 family)
VGAPEFANPSTLAAPLGQYSHVARVKAGSDLYFLAGQVGLRPDGALPESIEAQAEEAFANINRALAAEGLSAANLVKLNIYAVMGSPIAGVREARLRAFGDARPASTFVFVPQLISPEYLIEVEAIAAR